MSRDILVIQTAFVGDLLLTIPLIQRLKKIFHAEIDLVCRKGLGQLMIDMGLVHRVFELDKKKGEFSSEDFKNKSYEALFCPHQSLRSARIAWQVQASRKVAYKKWWNGGIFNERVARPMRYPEAFRALALAQSMDDEICSFFASNATDYRFMKESNWPEWADMRLPSNSAHREEWLLIAPGSVWNTKRWTESGFAEVAQHFLQKNYRVTLIGAPDEKDVCERVARDVKGIENLCGETSLSESYQIFQKAQIIVGNDSGAIHLAAAAGLPSVSVFGPTTLDLGYRPWQKNATVEEVDINCRPCGLHGAKKCPIGTHECMTRVSAEQVIASAERLIESL